MSNFSIYILIFCVYVVLILMHQRFNHLDDKLDMLFKMEGIKLLIGEDAETNFEEVFGGQNDIK